MATEAWVASNLYCPACSSPKLIPSKTGFAVTDFACPVCNEEFQLKAKRGLLGSTITDAAYSQALRAAEQNAFPNLLLLGYQTIPGPVVTLQAIPGPFITPTALEPRRPLTASARRAGWIGCNIVIGNLPQSARIAIIADERPRQTAQVRSDWRRWDFLRERDVSTRTWLNEILRRVESLGKQEFTLEEVYAFEEDLSRIFPHNRFVRPKIRQQLQVLRDRGFLEFRERGRYRYVPNRRVT